MHGPDYSIFNNNFMINASTLLVVSSVREIDRYLLCNTVSASIFLLNICFLTHDAPYCVHDWVWYLKLSFGSSFSFKIIKSLKQKQQTARVSSVLAGEKFGALRF
jgi:hypothetical protein